MRTVVRDSGEDEAVARAQAVYDAAVRARNGLDPLGPAGSGLTDRKALAQAEVEMAAEALDRARNSQFELSAQDMSYTVALMATHGMLDETAVEPSWPDPPEFGLSPVEASPALDMSITMGELPQRLRRYRAALDAVADQVSEVPAGIPEYKLSSNDGWLVSCGEIDAGLSTAGLRVQNAHPDVYWWREWIDWLGYACAHGGFRVY